MAGGIEETVYLTGSEVHVYRLGTVVVIHQIYQSAFIHFQFVGSFGKHVVGTRSVSVVPVDYPDGKIAAVGVSDQDDQFFTGFDRDSRRIIE